MTWRLIDEGREDIFHSLALEEALARTNTQRHEKISTLRFWRAESAVVIGRFQCSHKEVNFKFCNNNNISIARRFTGGGAVFHDLGNLNFALCMDQSEQYIPRTLPELYFNFIGGIATGLREIGIPSTFDSYRSCIRINGKKITGTAGWIKRGVSFIHGTILIDADLEKLAKSLSPPSDQPVYLREPNTTRCLESKRDYVTTIIQEIPNPPSLDEVKNAIINTVEKITMCKIERGSWKTDEMDLAEALYRTRYSKPEWNLGYLATG
ncbi:MAG: lipoate--protein ligase family protein [Candidatus Thorarchaeota archaeon]